jgi:putative hydrolase of the HAD superfamily
MKRPLALVFDLGNVLLPIDLDKTYEAFALLSSQYTATEIKQITQDEALWSAYESGLQSDREFELFLVNRLQLVCSSEQFHAAFNALLLRFDQTLCNYIKDLKVIYPIYLLSNTSRIHSRLFLQTNFPNYNLFDAFVRVHLSFEMGVVKPDVAIYNQLVIENDLQDHHIVFFDDNVHNIDSALNFGWEAVLIDPSNSLHQIQQHINSLC